MVWEERDWTGHTPNAENFRMFSSRTLLAPSQESLIISLWGYNKLSYFPINVSAQNYQKETEKMIRTSVFWFLVHIYSYHKSSALGLEKLFDLNLNVQLILIYFKKSFLEEVKSFLSTISEFHCAEIGVRALETMQPTCNFTYTVMDCVNLGNLFNHLRPQDSPLFSWDTMSSTS